MTWAKIFQKMNSDLEWLIIRNNSCFLVKRAGKQFSTEQRNILGRNSRKFNSLIQNWVNIQPSPKGVTIQFKGGNVEEFDSVRKAAKFLKTLMVEKHYRRDLYSAALGRVTRLVDAQRKRK